ncbi:phage minor head protein [Salmonella enterica subsp. diarizonae]|uniref:phage minor head protein n=1 Tax=Salmonella enterica TaxID=28901 RepID=UPI00201666FF|nr:phage minor head protein [Salmonella enterica]
MRPPTPSKRAEVWYRDRLTEFIDGMVQAFVDELGKPTLTDDTDTTPLSITTRLAAVMQRLASISVSEVAARLSAGFVTRANLQNKEQTQRTFFQAFGIDLTGMLGEAAIKPEMEKAVSENVDLITSIHTNFIHDIGAAVFDNMKDGGRHENLIDLIKERGEITRNRARFIARDKTSKLNADLTEARNVALGLDLYEWGGTGDERERDTHFVLNHMLCKYSDPTVYSDDGGKTWKKRSTIGAFIGKPGEDYQCRCLALPYVSWD